MRALVKGAVNDVRTRILLDTGANVSVISANYAKRLRLREVPDHGRSLEVRGINAGVLETRRRALVKITLGWERVYEFEMWIMNHSAGVDVVLGTDFMIPAGVRLDLFHGTARLLDEVMVPLIKSLSAADDEPYGTQVVGGPTEDLYIPDYTGPNIQNKDLDVGQQQKLVDVLKRHEKIMISSGNALPPPAYGVVCDIDVQGHAPIKQRARRTPLRFLGKLYQLLKGLLRTGLITFSDSPWASPIVIVLKKNGVDIHLCIDYKMVNAVTAIMYPTGDMFANGESDESSLVPVFDRRSFVDDICFGNKTFDGCLAMLDRLLQRFTECRISVSFTKSIFVQSKVDFLSHEVSSEGIRADPKKIKAVTEIPFPTSKKGIQSFLGALNYYSRFIQDFAVYGAALYQLMDADFAPGGDLTVAKRSFAALQQKVMDAPILRHFDRDKEVYVMLFANEWALSSTLMQEHDGKLHPVRFCGRVLKDAEMNYHPAEKEILALLLLLKVCYTQLAEWTIVTAASACLEATTVNLAEYAGMNNGVQAALEHTTEALVIVGDSRLAIQQSLGVIACRKESLLTQLNRHRELTAKFRSVKYLHVVREFNAAVDSLASETLESKVFKVVSTETRLSELVALNRIQDVIYEPTAKAEIEDKPSTTLRPDD
ncbi:Eukaryotic/viral aspartic protease [Phytophthora palmivora]|uniref:Eukaryotic/viral aspartic protease n=1 Tax=Phytophthora palmivora TaxID=4796 RepID=A0A2P4XLN1_9STRA|nr:Eukaryotic/viral aspartic protease [Phytophthora palmivora]